MLSRDFFQGYVLDPENIRLDFLRYLAFFPREARVSFFVRETTTTNTTFEDA